MIPESMILRFRDLSTNPGETIKLHKEKIVNHGFTWWGWWNKAGETVPTETFRAFMARQIASPISWVKLDHDF